MSYTRFNRHESMKSETLSEIMNIIREVTLSKSENSFSLQNMMYGLFDGYLYEDIQLYALELSTELCSRVMKVYDICKRYPQSETQIY